MRLIYKNNELWMYYGVPGKDGSGELWDYTLVGRTKRW